MLSPESCENFDGTNGLACITVKLNCKQHFKINFQHLKTAVNEYFQKHT